MESYVKSEQAGEELENMIDVWQIVKEEFDDIGSAKRIRRLNDISTKQ